MTGTIKERFFAKVIKTKKCWVWLGAIIGGDGAGYGQFRAEGQHRVLAHRWIYEQTNGKIRKGTEIDHLCRNRACVNPSHLEAVTHQENLLRGPHIVPCKHGKRARSHCDVCTTRYHKMYRSQFIFVRIPPDLKRWIQVQARRARKTPSMWTWLVLEDHRETYTVERERQARRRGT